MLEVRMTTKEKLMYEIITQLSCVNTPLVFKGGLITRLILNERGYTSIQRSTKDIDANWINSSPTMDSILDTINKALGDYSNCYYATINRNFGENRSAGISIIERNSDEKVVSMDIDIKPLSESKIYYYGEMSIRGVFADEIIADKISSVSSEAVYKNRAKDIVDLYSLTHCVNVDIDNVLAICKKNNRTIYSFEAFINRKDDIKHAYNKLRGIEGKPNFDDIYNYLKKFLGPFILNETENKIWDINKSIWISKELYTGKFYYIKTNQTGLDNLYKSGIDFEAHESDTKDMFIVRVSTADKEKATQIINTKPPTIK